MDLSEALNQPLATLPGGGPTVDEPDPVGLEVLHSELLVGVRAIIAKSAEVYSELKPEGADTLVLADEASRKRVAELLARLREAKKQIEAACRSDLAALKLEMAVYTEQRDALVEAIALIDAPFSAALIAATKTVEHGTGMAAPRSMIGSLGSTASVVERHSGKLAADGIEYKTNKHGEPCLRIRVPERYLKPDWKERLNDLFAWKDINSALAGDKDLVIPGIERVKNESTSTRAREIVG